MLNFAPSSMMYIKCNSSPWQQTFWWQHNLSKSCILLIAMMN